MLNSLGDPLSALGPCINYDNDDDDATIEIHDNDDDHDNDDYDDATYALHQRPLCSPADPMVICFCAC